MECDVLVIGAGPAGISAALAAAKAGARVMFWEKRREIGVPVRCSGAISSYLIPMLPFEIPKEFLLWKNSGVLFSADNVAVTRRHGIWPSYAIDRRGFEAWLAESAVKAGAELRLDTELVELKVDKNLLVGKAVARSGTGWEEVEPTVVIAADGADSLVSRKIGMRRADCVMGRGLVYEFKDVELASKDLDQIFFGDFVPGGYAHVFPTSESTANIGVGSILKDADLERYLREFSWIPEVRKQLLNSKVTGERSGTVTFSHPIDKKRYGNIFFAGEAAGQNIKPLVEGFLPAMICGSIAGESAAEHIAKGTPLDIYEENLRSGVGPLFAATDRYIDALLELSVSKEEQSPLITMGLCSGVFSVEEFGELKKEGYRGIKRRLEDWNASRLKQVKNELEERIWASYLRILKYKKLFKFED